MCPRVDSTNAGVFTPFAGCFSPFFVRSDGDIPAKQLRSKLANQFFSHIKQSVEFLLVHRPVFGRPDRAIAFSPIAELVTRLRGIKQRQSGDIKNSDMMERLLVGVPDVGKRFGSIPSRFVLTA